MKLRTLLFVCLIASQTATASAQEAVAHFDMNEGSGTATRFDGYTKYVKAEVPVNSFSTEALTVNVILAAESYPMMQVDVAETTPTFATICGNLDGRTHRHCPGRRLRYQRLLEWLCV